MSLKRRIADAEHVLAMRDDITVVVFLHGRGDELARARVAEARENGWKLKLIRFGVQHVADTTEEADRLVAEHKEERGATPITVYRKGRAPDEVLARWDPGLPDWFVEEGARPLYLDRTSPHAHRARS